MIRPLIFHRIDGSPICIAVTSPDGFVGLHIWIFIIRLTVVVSDMDLADATNLRVLNARYNQLTSLDVSQ